MKSLTDEERELILIEMKRFETKRSAILPALYLIQKDRGWIPDLLVRELASFMEIPAAHVLEVRSFYTMFNEKPVGKLHVQVCTNLSCSMNGGREMAKSICEKYEVGYEEISSCGKVTVSRVECLGACDKAPMMQVNDRYYEDLTSETAVQILEGLKV